MIYTMIFKHSFESTMKIKHHLWLSHQSLVCFEAGSHVAQVSLELLILLPLPSNSQFKLQACTTMTSFKFFFFPFNYFILIFEAGFLCVTLAILKLNI